MSIMNEAKLPSLKDKIREQVEKETEVEDKKDKKIEVEIKKGRRLNK